MRCDPGVSELSLQDARKENICQIKNLPNRFLVRCTPFMNGRYALSCCSSWCNFFASCLNTTEKSLKCNFRSYYRSFKLVPVSGTEPLPSVTKQINVEPCGPYKKRSFVIDIKVCNCTKGGKFSSC